MKSILYIIITFLASSIIYGQGFEDLKKADTIYIEFKGRKNEKKDIIHAQIKSNNFIERVYNFSLFDKQKLSFQYSTFKNWEKQEANIMSEVRKVNKSFLKKNKNKIISTYLLDQFDYEEIVCEIFSQLKTIYIIDYTEKKQKEIVLYEVVLINYCPAYE